MKIKLLDDLKSILNAPHETAAAREALSQALTGRVVAAPKPDKEKTDAKLER